MFNYYAPSSSDRHKGLRHARWDDEVQWNPCRADRKGQARDQDAHREMQHSEFVTPFALIGCILLNVIHSQRQKVYILKLL